MFKLIVVAAALALAQASAQCDETNSYDIIRANEKNVMCGSVVYDPTKYRCCGKTLRRLPTNRISIPSSQDANIDKAYDSQFCYGKEHVSSRQMVCGGAIVDSGTWNSMGMMTSAAACCYGTAYNMAETTYDSNQVVTAKAVKGCCAGTVTDLVTDANFAATLMCCGAETYVMATETCCANTQTKDAAKFTTDALKTCCGNTYMTTDALKTCCGNTYETALDSNGNTLGFCCKADSGYLPMWMATASVMTKTTAPATGSTDAIWTTSSGCGCMNKLVALADVEGQDKPLMATEHTCAGGKDDAAPCPGAAAAFTNGNMMVGCCSGTAFFTSNSWCIGMYDQAKSVEFTDMGAAFEETANKGKHLRKNFNDGLYDLMPVSTAFSAMTYNDNSDVTSMYCGKSSATTAVASVLAACLAFLAL